MPIFTQQWCPTRRQTCKLPLYLRRPCIWSGTTRQTPTARSSLTRLASVCWSLEISKLNHPERGRVTNRRAANLSLHADRSDTTRRFHLSNRFITTTSEIHPTRTTSTSSRTNTCSPIWGSLCNMRSVSSRTTPMVRALRRRRSLAGHIQMVGHQLWIPCKIVYIYIYIYI